MLSDDLLSALVCPRCAGDIGQNQPDGVCCLRCNYIYALENDIPVLLRDSQQYAEEMKQRITARPSWHCSDQLKSADEGPYRHHLRKRVEYIWEVINRHRFGKPRVLDIGCGDGANLRHLVRIPGSTVFGTDYNMDRLLKARGNLKGQVLLILSDILENNFRKDYFDIVLCNHVLEHIERDLDALSAIYTILKPGGLLILGTPNEGAFTWQLNYRVVQPYIMERTDHVHFYTASRLKKLVEKAGFYVEQTRFIGWGVPHTAVDMLLRQHKWIDDLFDIGRWVCKSQATSLYLICKK